MTQTPTTIAVGGHTFRYIPLVSDEFNLNTMSSIWTTSNNYYSESTIWMSSNFTFGKKSSLISESNTTVCNIISHYSPLLITVTNWNGTRGSSNLICGSLQSQNTYKYGYYEARMKEPSSDVGVSSAFWLISGGENGLYSEIDIQENNSEFVADGYDIWNIFHKGQGKSQLRNAIAYQAPGDPRLSYDWPLDQTLDIKDANSNLVDITTTFHTYGLDWQPTYIDFYMDGILKTHFTSSNFLYHYANGQSTNLPVSSLIPQQVILWTKSGNQANYPVNNDVNLEVDYFRYYRNNPEISSSSIIFGASRLADLTFSNNIPDDTYSFSSGTKLNTNTVRLQPSNDVTNLTVTNSFTYPTGTAQISKSILFLTGTANLCNNSTNNIIIANAIVAPLNPCTNAQVYHSGQNVNYIARDYIVLNSGFEVQLGATFSSEVKGQ